VSEWSSWLAVLVYAHDRSGSGAAGWTALGLLVPALLVAPFVSRAAGGARPIRTLTLVYGIQAVSLAVASVLVAADASLLAVISLVAVAIGGIAYVRPSYPVIAPALVRTAHELTSSNLYAGYCDSGCVLVGPLTATAFLALGGPALVLAVCASMAVAGVMSTATLLHLDRPVDDDVSDLGESPSLWNVIRSLRGHDNVPALLTVLAAQHVVMGVVGLMFVVLAVDELGMSGSGAGVLNIAFGIGAVCSGVGATLMSGRRRIAPAVAVCLAVSAMSMMAIGSFTTLAVTLVALGLAGCSRSLLDVTTRILLQRSAPPAYLSSVFAFIEVLTSVGLAVGTIFAQVTVATVGAPRGLVLLGGTLLLVLAATGRTVWRADRAADVPVVEVALLRSMPLFAPLNPSVLEAVARSAVEVQVESGEVLIREGEAGDRYFAVAAGEFDVSTAGTVRRRVGRGEGVGEIALLRDVPRTATVVARTVGTVFAIDRDAFLLAVTGNDTTHQRAWQHIGTLQTSDEA
jgi:hypothetical protein